MCRLKAFEAGNIFVHFLYQMPAFGAFDDSDEFLESTTSKISKSCQVRGSNPCRGAKLSFIFNYLGKRKPTVCTDAVRTACD
jgi:hypothetical protein